MSLPATAWRPAYVGIGSNVAGKHGDPARQVDAAVDALADLPDTRLIASSSRYRSAPFGGVDQPDFVNAAAALLTRLAPRELLGKLKALEASFGRTAGGTRWGPRELDLDLLVYAGLTLDDPDLRIPHPGIGERNFVLLPLRELAPDLVIPGLGRVRTLPVDERAPCIARLA